MGPASTTVISSFYPIVTRSFTSVVLSSPQVPTDPTCLFNSVQCDCFYLTFSLLPVQAPQSLSSFTQLKCSRYAFQLYKPFTVLMLSDHADPVFNLVLLPSPNNSRSVQATRLFALFAPNNCPALRALTLTCLLLAVLSFAFEIKDSSFYRQRRIKKGRFGPRKNRKSQKI